MKNEKGYTLVELLIAIVLLCVIVPAIGVSVYGLVLAFKASIILGIIVLALEPSPFVIGLCALFGKNVAEALQNWIHFPV